MQCCYPTIQGLPLASKDTRSLKLFTLPQWNIYMCRAQWLVKPYPTDEGAIPADCREEGWIGAAKAIFWLAAAVGTGLLIAGLGGG